MNNLSDVLRRPAVGVAVAGGVALSAWAQGTPEAAPSPPEDTAPRYVLGAQVLVKPAYSGGAGYQTSLHPLWALRLGRWRITTGGGVGGLLDNGADAGSGASTDLVRNDRWAASLALRLDGGRQSSDDPALAGLPDVRRTVRARVAARRQLGDGWALDASLSEDLLGRGGGATASLGGGYGGRWTPATTWGAGGGVTLGNAQYLRARYGVPEGATLGGTRPAFDPHGGLVDVHLGLGTVTRLDERWVLLTGVGLTHLLGPAADSPLTHKPTSLNAALGLAWRCCR